MRKSKLSGRRNRKGYRAFEALEARTLFAAHVAGDPTVYPTIQAAVDAAKPGAVIDVDAGTYSENVQIYKKLTIRGAQAGVDARSNVRLAGTSETILNGQLNSDGTRSASFYVAADGVTIDGFVVQGETSQSLSYGAGVVIAPKISGLHFYDNIVQNNVSGLFLTNYSSAQQAIIQHNVFRYNNNPGANGGRGIYTDGSLTGGNLTNVLIDSNAFIGNYGSTGTTGLEGAIAIESRVANSQSNITVSNNTFDYNGKAVLFYNATNIHVMNNMVTWCRDHYSAALRFEGGMSNVTIQGNTVYNNPGPAVRVDQKGFTGDNYGFVVTGNNFYQTDTNYSPRYALIVGTDQYSGMFDASNNYFGPGDGIQTNGNDVVTTPMLASPIGNLQVPYYGLASVDGAIIQAEDFDHGGEGVGYHDSDTTNTGGQDRMAGVDVEKTTDAGGGYDVGWTKAGEWLAYTVNATNAGTFDLALRIASGVSGGIFHVEIDGTNVTGAINVTSTGGTQNWTTITKSGIALSAGQHLLKVVFDTNNSSGYVTNLNWLKLTNTSVVATPAAPSGLIASALSATSVSLSWKDNSTNETGFVIERKTGSGSYGALATVGAGVTLFTDSTVQPGMSYTYRVRATSASGDSANSNEASVATPALSSVTYLSDLPFYGTTQNGWGPVERDQSVGGSGADDGNTLTLNGVTYAKGLGVHAYSEVTFNVAGAYGTFVSDVGVDDEETSGSSVDFQVFGDGVLLYDSGIMTPTSATKSINVSVSGVQMLKLVVADGGDGIDYDHADWANARLLAATAPAPTGAAPVAPSNLTAAFSGGKMMLGWADNASNEDGFRIERSLDGVNFTQLASVAANVTSYADATATSAGSTYYYRVVAYNSTGTSAYSNVASAMAPLTMALPTGWKLSTIGPVPAGAATFDGNAYNLSGAGTGISGSSDSFQYVYKSLSGDGQMMARVVSQSSTNSGALAGLMFRDGTAANAREVGVYVTPTGSIVFTSRSRTGGGTSTKTVAGAKGAVYLKLARAGSVFTGYWSTNGTSWTKVASVTISMPVVIDVGLALTSKSSTALNTAVIDSVLA